MDTNKLISDPDLARISNEFSNWVAKKMKEGYDGLIVTAIGAYLIAMRSEGKNS